MALCTDTRPSDIPLLPSRYYDAFDYASTDIRIKADQGMYTVRDKSVPVEVRLKDLNEIYIMDMGPKDEARERVDRAVRESGRRQGSHDEFCEVQTAAAKTLIPVTEYRGGFKRPVYVIGRHILADEARFMKGPIRVAYDGDALAITMKDGVSGLVATFNSRHERPGLGLIYDTIRDAESIAYHVDRGLEIDIEVTEEMERREEARKAKAPTPTTLPM